MIISRAKHQDLETYNLVVEILEVAIRAYKRNPTEYNFKHVNELATWMEDLKLKMATHNYTEDDARIVRVDKWLELYRNTVVPTSP